MINHRDTEIFYPQITQIFADINMRFNANVDLFQ